MTRAPIALHFVGTVSGPRAVATSEAVIAVSAYVSVFAPALHRLAQPECIGQRNVFCCPSVFSCSWREARLSEHVVWLFDAETGSLRWRLGEVGARPIHVRATVSLAAHPSHPSEQTVDGVAVPAAANTVCARFTVGRVWGLGTAS